MTPHIGARPFWSGVLFYYTHPPKNNYHYDQKKDFNALFVTWFRRQLDEVFGTTTEEEEILEWIDHHHFFTDDAQKDAVRILYDLLNGFPKQTKRTAGFFGIDPKTVYNYTKK